MSKSQFPVLQSYNKMNVLHLHISDTASFPVEIIKQPNVTYYGAYGTDKVYTQQQLAGI
jgi:N-acetyl-beta-hexosaminidase